MQTPSNTQTQFSLRSILILTAIVAGVFAVLGAIGVSPLNLAIGIGVILFSIILTIAVIETIARLVGQR